MFEKSMTDQAVQRAEQALESAHCAADQAINGVSNTIDKGMGQIREATHQLRDSANRATEGTSTFIRHDPIKSVLIAAATGAALMALVSLLTRTSARS
jgi:ElaB/YqjD/DUF883 family membrane-anchored ribosome-binding protein